MRRGLTTLATALAGALAAVVLVRAHERALDAAAGEADDVSPEVARIVSLARASGFDVEDWQVRCLEQWISDGATSNLTLATSDGGLVTFAARPR